MPELYKTVEFYLLQKVRNKITGVEGVITAYAIYATGCIHYAVNRVGLDKDGKPFEVTWNDALYLEAVAPAPEARDKERSGGPSDDPPSGL